MDNDKMVDSPDTPPLRYLSWRGVYILVLANLVAIILFLVWLKRLFA